MMQIFRRRKSKESLIHLFDLHPGKPFLPAVVEPVLLNDVSVQTMFMPSADVLPWYPDDDDPGPEHKNRECRIKHIRIDTSDFTSDLYPEFDNN